MCCGVRPQGGRPYCRSLQPSAESARTTPLRRGVVDRLVGGTADHIRMRRRGVAVGLVVEWLAGEWKADSNGVLRYFRFFPTRLRAQVDLATHARRFERVGDKLALRVNKDKESRRIDMGFRLYQVLNATWRHVCQIRFFLIL